GTEEVGSIILVNDSDDALPIWEFCGCEIDRPGNGAGSFDRQTLIVTLPSTRFGFRTKTVN
ncbi:MAG: hypothetical protein ACI91T_001146, partial [Natronomonas sp.]